MEAWYGLPLPDRWSTGFHLVWYGTGNVLGPLESVGEMEGSGAACVSGGGVQQL